MKRAHPLLSPLGLGMTLAMLITLGASLLYSGGEAFSPGRVSALSDGETLGGFTSHADFEKECKRCHQPLATTMDVLCLDCHTRQQVEITSGEGVHGSLAAARDCKACHSEHQGRDFDLNLAAAANFDHSQFAFVLDKHPVDYHSEPLPCAACHGEDASSTAELLERCTECHRAHHPQFMDEHLATFGPNCLECHDGHDRMADFEHAATSFPLEGRHASLACAACHTSGTFQQISTACQDCHAEPGFHRGLFAQTCGDCHTAQAWSPANFQGQPFSHETATAFSLVKHTQDYAGQAITCETCHTGSAFHFKAQSCVDCHGEHDLDFVTAHQAAFGPNCTTCHDGLDSMADFDHATIFVLDGRHSEISCLDCHPNRVFDQASSECVTCHAEPDIHAGFFGLHCHNCHTTTAWHPARLTSHTFPLDHGETVSDCQTCHPTTYDQYTCYGCHEHQPGDILEEHLDEGISQAELPECARCHPTGQEEE